MKVKRLKKLMEDSLDQHRRKIEEAQKQIYIDPSNAYHLSIKIASHMNQIKNIRTVIEICETLNPEDSILDESV